MTESVDNETIEKYWCFLSRMFLLDMTSKKIGYVDYVYAIIKMKI
jgi:hypothetical protein